MSFIDEEDLENISLGWFKEIGYSYVHGPDIAPDGKSPERNDLRKVFLLDRLRNALINLNPKVPAKTIESAITQITNPNIPGLLASNRQFHQWITKGFQISFMDGNEERGMLLKIIDFEAPTKNDFLVINQLKVAGPKYNRIPDVVVYINGIPIAVIELKNPADQKADIWDAYNQLQTYKDNIPDLFTSNVLLVISDGTYAKVGSISANEERFQRWRVIEKEQNLDPLGQFRELETLVRGLFDKRRLLDFIRSFCLFEEDGEIIKKIAAYHQFYAVNNAIERVVEASSSGGNRKGGVVWHTQGAGKSIEMACLAGKLLTDKRLQNPTLIFVTDRNDLDGQLFGVFSCSGGLLGEPPKQAENKEDLRGLLDNIPSGGIIFTTIQKFAKKKEEDKFPQLTSRENIIVICDEAHRSQYGFKARFDSKTGEIKYGLARGLRDALPNATFLAFTGTPISYADKDTQSVFGHYISIYDIQQAVEDKATVPIYYESRQAKLVLKKDAIPIIDSREEEIFADEDEVPENYKKKSRWAALEKLVGSPPRLKQIANDLIKHYEKRSEIQSGKALVVGMSREICASLYKEIIAIKPEWEDSSHMKGSIKVVMTAKASDKSDLQKHNTNKQQRDDLAKRFKDPNDPLKIVLVRNMWLTGFDAPCLSTMYIDKPMKGANLAQAIARVNRVFKDKPGGLIVDYIGFSPQLKEALATYTGDRGTGKPALDIEEALLILKEQIEIANDLLFPIEWENFQDKEKAFHLIPNCLEKILSVENGKQRFCDTVLKITQSFSLCSSTSEAMKLADKVAFLNAIRAPLIKDSRSESTPKEGIDYKLQQLLSESLVAKGVTDIFKVAGLKNPDISILSNAFLEEVYKIPQKNLAVELLQKLINDEVKTKFRTNVVKQKRFSEMLKASLNKYENRAIEAAQVIEELIEMAKKFREDLERGIALGLSSAERSFYDALAENPSAKKLMEEKVLANMAKELAEIIRRDANIDWQYKENVRAKLRLKIKTLLKRYKYPPDGQITAVETVLQQAETLGKELVAS